MNTFLRTEFTLELHYILQVLQTYASYAWGMHAHKFGNKMFTNQLITFICLR